MSELSSGITDIFMSYLMLGTSIILIRAGLSKCGARLEALLRGPTQVRSQIIRCEGQNKVLGGQYFAFTVF